MNHARSVLISGASTGIGEATARHFGAMGWNVWAGVRTDEAAERLGASPGVTALRLDVTDSASVEHAVARVEDERADAGLDVLVNNAGVVCGGPLEFIGLDEWYAQFEVNLFGVVRLTRAALPMLRLAIDPRIIMIGSINSRLGVPLLGPYAASKHALAGLASSLRRELAPAGPLVTLLEPGAVRTDIWPKGVDTVARLERSLPAEALQRYGSYVASQRVHLRDGDHRGIAPSAVAAVIEASVRSRRPRARQLVGRDAQIGGALARLLPDRAMDVLFAALHRRALRSAAKPEAPLSVQG